MNSNLKYELELLNRGIRYVAGIDEVGRGPLAGPLVVAAVVFDLPHLFEVLKNEKSAICSVDDSKKVTEKHRIQLVKEIIEESIEYSIIEVTASCIDDIGIGKANRNAFSKAHTLITKVKIEHILTDFFEIENISKEKQTNIVGGDALSYCIGAASIVAKVHRDRIMIEKSKIFPQYAFERNKGYGTREHFEALSTHGPCIEHRKSFEPIKSMVGWGRGN